jgi:hypothetical protein
MKPNRRGAAGASTALSPSPMISTRWTRRKSRSCSTATNEASARHPHFGLGCVEPERLSRVATSLIESPDNEMVISALSLWEIAIKTGRGRADFASMPVCCAGVFSITVMPNSL